VEWRRLWHDLPYVYRFLWGERSPDGSWRPGLNLGEAYQAWLRAADQAARDPHSAGAVMELCRQRIAACVGGPVLLRVYAEHLYAGMGPVEAMRRAWAETEPARQFAGRAARPHGGAPRRGELRGPGPAGRNLPVPAASMGGERAGGRLPVEPGPRQAAVEAAQLLGVPEVTVPRLRRLQDRLGGEAERDGAVLARRWLADATAKGGISPAQHDAWLAQVEQERGSPQYARWRVDNGLAGQLGQAAVVAPAAAGPAPDEQARGGAATGDHLAGHAGQHHRNSEQLMGRAVDDPATAAVDEQDQFRLRGHAERGLAERYEHQAAADGGLRARAVAARPSPASVVRAARPADLVGKQPAWVVAARPVPPRPPVPGR
jgi:hypothetical protein